MSVRVAILLLISLSLVGVAVSGCIEPADLQAHSEDRADDHQSHGSSEEECEAEDDPNHTSGGSDTHHDELEPDAAFEDAHPRYANVVDGDEDSRRTISLPFGADALRVALVHDSDADVSFVLRDPLHRTWAREQADGEKYLYEKEWALVERPLPGDWTLDIEIDGGSSYTIGFYIDD